MRIAVLAGSRGIFRIADILRWTGEELKRRGALPFVVPAMGSHGGATARGQRQVLAGYGITEAAVGMPILASMRTDLVGVTDSGVPVRAAREALAADLIVPVNRVKPHTDFRGPVECGLCKMLAVGLGTHAGCSRLHQEGFASFPELIPQAARVVIATGKVGFGLAIVENAHDRTMLVRAVRGEDIPAEEPALLRTARAAMPRLPFREIDVLVVEEIGKDVSGAGMDPNVTGRGTFGPLPGFDGPKIGRILVLGLTRAAHGNACGIGAADFALASCLQQVDLRATAVNSIASGAPEGGRLPIGVQDEREGILAALCTCPGCAPRPQDRQDPQHEIIGGDPGLRSPAGGGGAGQPAEHPPRLSQAHPGKSKLSPGPANQFSA